MFYLVSILKHPHCAVHTFVDLRGEMIVEENFWPLSLNNSVDSYSRLCRAFIIKFYNDNEDFNEALSILNSEKDNTTLRLFDKFFNSGLVTCSPDCTLDPKYRSINTKYNPR